MNEAVRLSLFCCALIDGGFLYRLVKTKLYVGMGFQTTPE